MSLFELKDFVMHSGQVGHWKIECDALTDEDWDTIAYWVSTRFSFRQVEGIPTGGEKFQHALFKYRSPNSNVYLVVDDVLTTGGSMNKFKRTSLQSLSGYDIKGVVLFARGECPDWVTPIFKMWN